MRLIDADALIDRMYHDAFETDTDMQKWDSGCWIRYKMFENAIEDAPSIDIVRCQDCRHRYMDADLQVWTCTYGLMIKPDGFCNYGEVRDE